MSYRVEYKNDHGDWIFLSGPHKDREHAEIVAECTYRPYEKRIVEETDGKGD